MHLAEDAHMIRSDCAPGEAVPLASNHSGIRGRPVIAGDIGAALPEESRRFAGHAVLNVIWHLQALGCEPILLSRIGTDAVGEQVLRLLEGSGIDTTAIQLDSKLPTRGQEHPGEPASAWSSLERGRAVEAIRRCEPSLLYHGIAATDSEHLRAVLNAVHNRIGMPFAIDLSEAPRAIETVRHALLGVKWVKIDADQMPALIDESKLRGTRSKASDALAIVERFALEGVVAERDGLPILSAGRAIVARGAGIAPDQVRFLPGGRDAATAATIMGWLFGWPPKVMIERATQLAYLAGAAPVAQRVDPDVYTSVLAHWGVSQSQSEPPA
jgi:fructokinase